METERLFSRVLVAISVVLIVISQLIDSNGAAVWYRPLTLIAEPLLFVVAGYWVRDLTWANVIVNGMKRYVGPYLITGFVLGIANKLIQHFNGLYWFQAPFPRLQDVAATFLYGNGWPTNGVFTRTSYGVGLIWLALGLFVATIIFKGLLTLLPKRWQWQWLAVVIIAWFGFYISTFFQLPWSIAPALVAQPLLMLGYQLRQLPDWQVGLGTALVGLIVLVGVSTTGPFDLIVATAPHWFFTTIASLLGVLMVVAIVQRLIQLVPSLMQAFSVLGNGVVLKLGLFTLMMALLKMGGYLSLITNSHTVNVSLNIVITLVVLQIITDVLYRIPAVKRYF